MSAIVSAKKMRRGAAGQQYAIVVGLIAVIAIAAITQVGGGVKGLMLSVANRLSGTEAVSSGGGGGGLTPGTVYAFNTCGATGPNGPSACPYTATTLAGAVTVSGGYQLWSVPVTGTYRIEAYGAAGADANNFTSPAVGGLGAYVKNEVVLTSGTQILVLVGQRGVSANEVAGAGGGSFVTQGVTSPASAVLSNLIVAAGGGGGYGNNIVGQVGAYQAGQANNNGSTGIAGGYPGGTGGNGGSGGNGSGWGGGGGGFLTNGGNDSIYGSGGLSFKNGGTGGAGGTGCGNNANYQAAGGFGGGGAGGCAGGSAGGGYSGGGASGGGGGSYYGAGANQAWTAGVRSGNGAVTITYLTP